MPVRDYAGAAKQARLTADFTGTDITAACDDLSDWPDGGANGKFFVTFENNEVGEERTLAASRSGNTLTFSGLGDRGLEGTAAILHPTGTTVQHTFSATEAEEANQHIFNTALDQHTQYLNVARHDITGRHAFGAALGTPGTPVQLTPDTAGAAGTGVAPAREDHRHNIQAATAVTSGLANAEGVSTSFARADHTHDQAALSVSTAELVDLGVTEGKLANLSVTSGKLAALAVTAGKIAAGAINAANLILDATITLAKLANEDPVDLDASVTFVNPSANYVQGTGGYKTARLFRIGKLRVMFAAFQLGTGGNIASGGDIEISLPDANNANFRGFCAARARISGGASSNETWSGTGVIATSATAATNFATAGSTLNWNATNPFNWDDADSFDAILIWVAS